MLEEVQDLIESWDLEWDKVGLAFLFWALSLIWIWKFADDTVMRFHVKIILTILIMPLCYILIKLIANR